MNNRLIFFFALLACLVVSLDIRMGSITNKPLLDEHFPSGSQKYQYEKNVVGNNSDLLEIYKTIRSWKTDAQISQDFTTQQSSSLHQGGYVINYYYFRSPINQIMRLNFSPRSIWPGTIIQLSNPNDYSKGLIPHYVTEDKRNTFNLTFSNGLSGRIEGVTNAVFYKKLNERIKEQIDMFNKKNIELYIYKFSEVEAALRNLGLTSSAYQDLLLSQNSNGDFANRRTTIVLLQPLFSVSVDFPQLSQTKRMNLVQAIFTPKYKFDQFMGTAMYGYWKYNNVPQIVTQTNYGRLLIITVQENKMGQNQIQSLLRCYKQSKIINEDCFDSAMIAIQSNPSIRSYFGGVNPSKAYELRRNMPIVMQNINWRKAFFEFASPEQVQYLEPLSGNMMNLLGQKYIQIDTLNFYTLARNKFPTIDFRIEEVSSSADVSYRIAGQSEDVWLSRFTQPQVVEAGNKIGWNDFTLKISINGDKTKKWYHFFTSSQYRFKLVMNVIINGIQVLRINQNSKNKDGFLNFDYRLKASI